MLVFIIKNTGGAKKLQKHFYKIMRHYNSTANYGHAVTIELNNTSLTLSTITKHYELHGCSVMYCMLSYMFLLCVPFTFLNVEKKLQTF